MKKSLFCIIHYQGDYAYSNIKDISSVNEERIKEAKTVREQEVGENRHETQCNSIPETIDYIKHGIHPDPCYKKFTKILSRKVESKDDKQRSSVRLSLASPIKYSTAWTYPKECNICKKWQIQVKGKKHFPQIIATDDAVSTIIAAAEQNDKIMHEEIKNECLIAKEFKFHSVCYRNFTRGFSRKEREKSTTNVPSTSDNASVALHISSNFDLVKEYITDKILDQKQAISMLVLHEIYGLNPGDTRYRNKLKSRIQQAFPNKIAFLTAKHNVSEIVVDTCLRFPLYGFYGQYLVYQTGS